MCVCEWHFLFLSAASQRIFKAPQRKVVALLSKLKSYDIMLMHLQIMRRARVLCVVIHAYSVCVYVRIFYLLYIERKRANDSPASEVVRRAMI